MAQCLDVHSASEHRSFDNEAVAVADRMLVAAGELCCNMAAPSKEKCSTFRFEIQVPKENTS